MNLIGNRLVLPLFDAELTKCDKYDLCDGISLFTLPAHYKDRIRSHPDLIARYEKSIDFMKSAIAIQPDAIGGLETTNWSTLMELAVFVAMSIRLATGVPVDVPYWFDAEGDEIKGFGNTQVKTYRTDHRYLYPLDDGLQADGLNALQSGFNAVLEKHVNDANSNVLIRAIQFAAIAFQTRHIQSRLVNNTIYIETLFSGSNTEIAFQIASSVSWYLEFQSSSDKRIALFTEIKELYGYRSKIVHGADVSAKGKNLRRALAFSEMLNTRIFQRILNNNHVEIFSLKQDRRDKELKLLSLGADSALLA